MPRMHLGSNPYRQVGFEIYLKQWRLVLLRLRWLCQHLLHLRYSRRRSQSYMLYQMGYKHSGRCGRYPRAAVPSAMLLIIASCDLPSASIDLIKAETPRFALCPTSSTLLILDLFIFSTSDTFFFNDYNLSNYYRDPNKVRWHYHKH